MNNNTDIYTAFKSAIEKAGIPGPDQIIGDGELQKFSTNGKPKDKAGWYVLHADRFPYGVFGDHRQGDEKYHWKPDLPDGSTDKQKEACRRIIEGLNKKAAEEEKAYKASRLIEITDDWENAPYAEPDHPYLVAKGVGVHGIRQRDGVLIVPMKNADGVIKSFQRIRSVDKRYAKGGEKKGCFHTIGNPDKVLVVVEGYATGASIFEATGLSVIVAFDCGSLKSVAEVVRKMYPAIRMVFAADDDIGTKGNPGKTHAEEAAQAVGGSVVLPDFGKHRPDGVSDFNDLAMSRSQEEVKKQIEAALAVSPLETIEMDFSGILPAEYVIDNFLNVGVLILAADAGAGKTTAMVALALVSTGAIAYEGITAQLHRDVVYITEDAEQVQRILYGLIKHKGADEALIKKHFHVVEARRESVKALAPHVAFCKQHMRTNNCPAGAFEVPPLVVVDTMSATFAMDNENDNSEASNIIAAVKQMFKGFPVVIVAHTAKSNGRSDLESMKTRGAGSLRADVQGELVLYYDKDADRRYIHYSGQTKRRDQGFITDIEVTAQRHTLTIVDKYGYRREEGYLAVGLAPADAQSKRMRAAERSAEFRQVNEDWVLTQFLRALNKQRDEPANHKHYLSKHAIESRAVNETKRNITRQNVRYAIDELRESGDVEEMPLPASTDLSDSKGRKTSRRSYLALTQNGVEKARLVDPTSAANSR